MTLRKYLVVPPKEKGRLSSMRKMEIDFEKNSNRKEIVLYE